MKTTISQIPTNLKLNLVNVDGVIGYNPKDDERMILNIPAHGKYIEIMGHKLELDGVNSFETLVEYLKSLDKLERERVLLNSRIRQLEEDRKEFIRYLETKVEEGKLESMYYHNEYYPSIKEQLYTDILNKAKGVRNE